MDVFINQIDIASERKNTQIIITGDANIDANKWDQNTGNKVSINLRSCLDRNGINYPFIGNTYFADHAQANGNIAESALDHVYHRNLDVKTKIIANHSSDHNPVISIIKLNVRKQCFVRKVTKRSFKNYTPEKWNESLRNQNWRLVTEEVDLDKKVETFTKLLISALDHVAPIKSFIVKSHYKFGISEETKDLMLKRDNTRLKIKNAEMTEKIILMTQYKKLRNKVNAKIRAESVKFNNERINKANSEKETWNIINDVTNPKNQTPWILKTEQGETHDHSLIAETFNNYFNKKIVDLKNNIDPNLVEDPLKKMKDDTNRNSKSKIFKLKKTTEQDVCQALKK